MSEEIDVLLKWNGRFYEGKLHPQKVGSTVPQTNTKPIFPTPYDEMLSVIDSGDHWEVKPRSFLAKDDFSEIARIVRQYNGSYVSAGRSSYFRVPKG